MGPPHLNNQGLGSPFGPQHALPSYRRGSCVICTFCNVRNVRVDDPRVHKDIWRGGGRGRTHRLAPQARCEPPACMHLPRSAVSGTPAGRWSSPRCRPAARRRASAARAAACPAWRASRPAQPPCLSWCLGSAGQRNGSQRRAQPGCLCTHIAWEAGAGAWAGACAGGPCGPGVEALWTWCGPGPQAMARPS